MPLQAAALVGVEIAENGGASPTSRWAGSRGAGGRKVAAKTRVSAQVMCIFQLPAMTALRTGGP